MDRRSRLAIKLDAAVRLLMWRTMSDRLPLVLVSEYPKSGGTWFSQMLADYLGLPFPQNRMPPLERCIMHGHQAYHPSYRNAVYVLRDGRDVMVSAYFHMLFVNEKNHPDLVRETRAGVGFEDYDDVRTNLPEFMEYMFTVHDRRRFRFTWSEFVRQWSSSDAVQVRYEDLLADGTGTMARVIGELTGEKADRSRLAAVVERFSFENVARRKRGSENTRSFLRKGIAGDWRSKFSPRAREVFHRLAGDALIAAGYEPDDAWVSGSD